MAAQIKQYIEKSIHYIFPKNCFEEILIKFEVFHPKCSPLVLSRLLGVAITVLSSILFVPQILKIQQSKSGYGISLISQFLSLLAAISTAGYNYERGFVFGQWGDSFFISIQLAIIISQILWFSKYKISSILILILFLIISITIYNHQIPLLILSSLQASTIFIVLCSKGAQIIQNFSQSSFGQLSIISVFLQFFGSIARVFTSFQETGDWLIITPYLLSSALNGLIFAQIIYYGFVDSNKKKSIKSRETKKKN